jgi:nucleoside-diphosphate-sugar epimerase
MTRCTVMPQAATQAWARCQNAVAVAWRFIGQALGGGQPGVVVDRGVQVGGADTAAMAAATAAADHLLAAGRAVGIRRFIAQSIVAIGTYARTGGPVKTEDDPLDLDLPAKGRSGADALRYLEDAVTGIEGAEGIVLRYGAFYGPDTGLSADPEALLTKAIHKRRFPIIGDGGGVWSFVHLEDAASATVAAVDHGRPGIDNVVDDEPAPLREWLPFLAEQLGAKQPMRVPRFVGRLLAGEAPVLQMTKVRGGSNAKAKRVLGWQPRWSTWRVGFAKGLGE